MAANWLESLEMPPSPHDPQVWYLTTVSLDVDPDEHADDDDEVHDGVVVVRHLGEVMPAAPMRLVEEPVHAALEVQPGVIFGIEDLPAAQQGRLLVGRHRVADEGVHPVAQQDERDLLPELWAQLPPQPGREERQELAGTSRRGFGTVILRYRMFWRVVTD
jgi:hypothetical protein